MTLVLHGRHQVWESVEVNEKGESQQRQHVFVSTHYLEFLAANTLAPHLFEHLSELAAENWLKATTAWQRTSGLPLSFSSREPQTGQWRLPIADLADGRTG